MGFRRDYDRDVADCLRRGPRDAAPVAEADLAPLPPVARSYLNFAGAVGKPRVWNYRVRYSGQLRNGPKSRWMRIAADQHSFVAPAARLCLIRASLLGVPVQAFHRYVGPAATFQVRIASLLKVVDARGPEMNRSETVTMLSDLCLLAPAALIDPAVAWEDLGDHGARATFSNAGNTVSAVLRFDESGALADFTSGDRYGTTDGRTYEPVPWSTPVRSWRDFGGRRVPAEVEAVWHRPEGDFPYARWRVEEVEYNTPAFAGS